MICRPKASGGRGLLNTKKMNVVLMLKWVWRLYQEENTIWATIIRDKYDEASDLSAGSSHGGSQLWKSLHKLKLYFQVGAKFAVQNGVHTIFCLD
jgi:hypothetical protein